MTTPTCPVCGETALSEPRLYKIKGVWVRMNFAACLHTPEEIAQAKPDAPGEPAE